MNKTWNFGFNQKNNQIELTIEMSESIVVDSCCLPGNDDHDNRKHGEKDKCWVWMKAKKKQNKTIRWKCNHNECWKGFNNYFNEGQIDAVLLNIWTLSLSYKVRFGQQQEQKK